MLHPSILLAARFVRPAVSGQNGREGEGEDSVEVGGSVSCKTTS